MANLKTQSRLPVTSLFFEKNALLLRSRPYTGWFLISAILIGISGFLFDHTKNAVFAVTAMPLCLGIFLVPYGIKMSAIFLNRWTIGATYFIFDKPAEFDSWFRNQAGVFSGTRGMIYGGYLAAIAANATYGRAGAFAHLGMGPCFALAFIIALAGFCAWVGIINIYWLGRIIWRIGIFDLKVEAHPFGVLTTGKMLVECNLIASVIWCAFTSSAIGLRANWLPMLGARGAFDIFLHYVIYNLPDPNPQQKDGLQNGRTAKN